MTPASGRKLTCLFALYATQGLPFGFFTQALPVIMREQGHSLGLIGATTLLGLPWALKFLWAPLVDRWGSRRSWLLPLQGLTIALLLALAGTGQPAVGWLALALFLTNLLAATQDVASDGLAVDILEPRERGLANGIQVGAYRFGMVLGGGVLLVAFAQLRWTGTLTAMAALVGVATLSLLLIDEKPRPAPAPSGSSLAGFFRRRGAGRWLAALFLYKAGDAFGTLMLRPLLVDRGLTLADVGLLLGTLGFLAGLVGALVGGGLVTRLGRSRALLFFGLLQALTLALYALLASSAASRTAFAAVIAAEHVASGAATAALFTAMMDACDPRRGATDYTVQACAVVIATGLFGMLSGLSAQTIGYPAHFTVAALAGAAAAVLAWTTAPPEPARENA